MSASRRSTVRGVNALAEQLAERGVLGRVVHEPRGLRVLGTLAVADRPDPVVGERLPDVGVAGQGEERRREPGRVMDGTRRAQRRVRGERIGERLGGEGVVLDAAHTYSSASAELPEELTHVGDEEVGGLRRREVTAALHQRVPRDVRMSLEVGARDGQHVARELTAKAVGASIAGWRSCRGCHGVREVLEVEAHARADGVREPVDRERGRAGTPGCSCDRGRRRSRSTPAAARASTRRARPGSRSARSARLWGSVLCTVMWPTIEPDAATCWAQQRGLAGRVVVTGPRRE